MHNTEQAPTEEQKEAYNKAVNDYDELLADLAEKRTIADDLKYEIDDINHQVEARGQLESFANAAGEAMQAKENFENGAYADLTLALSTAKEALEGKTPNTDEYTAAERAVTEAQKKFDRAEGELAQLSEDAKRAEFETDRQFERDDANNRMAEARGEESYFLDVIEYMNAKLAFFQTVERGLNPMDVQAKEGPDYEMYLSIQPAKAELWDLLDSLYLQLDAIQVQISDLEYDEFVLKQRFASEDADAAQEDLERHRAWAKEAGEDADALAEERDALKDF